MPNISFRVAPMPCSIYNVWLWSHRNMTILECVATAKPTARLIMEYVSFIYSSSKSCGR